MAAKIKHGGYQECIISFHGFQLSQIHVFRVKSNVLDVSEASSNVKLWIRIQDGRQNPKWRLSILHNLFLLLPDVTETYFLCQK